MLIDAFLPEGITRLAVDSIFMMPQLGVLTEVQPKAATEVFEKDCLIHLGTCVAPSGMSKKPGPAMAGEEIELYVCNTHDDEAGAYERLLAGEEAVKLDRVEIHIPPGPRLGDVVIEAKGVSKGFGDRLLFENLGFSLKHSLEDEVVRAEFKL